MENPDIPVNCKVFHAVIHRGRVCMKRTTDNGSNPVGSPVDNG